MLVNSVNPDRIAGQQTAAWEIVETLGTAPAVQALLDGETAVMIGEEAGGLVLKGDNPDFTPLRFSAAEAADVRILGKVVGVYRNLKGKRRG